MKIKTIISIILISVTALFTGCETAPTSNISSVPLRTKATFSVSRDRVWPLLVSEVGLQYPVRAIEKDSGLITTDFVTLPAGYNNMNAASWIVPPGGFLATWSGLRMNMKILAVETEPGKTLVTINCHYEAYESNVMKGWIVANSNGRIESAILAKIESSVIAMPAAPVILEVPKISAASVLPVAPSKSVSDSLIEIKKLLDLGAITQAEYDAKKKVLIEKL